MHEHALFEPWTGYLFGKFGMADDAHDYIGIILMFVVIIVVIMTTMMMIVFEKGSPDMFQR